MFALCRENGPSRPGRRRQSELETRASKALTQLRHRAQEGVKAHLAERDCAPREAVHGEDHRLVTCISTAASDLLRFTLTFVATDLFLLVKCCRFDLVSPTRLMLAVALRCMRWCFCICAVLWTSASYTCCCATSTHYFLCFCGCFESSV